VAGLDLIAILEMGFPKIKGGPNFYHSNKENTGQFIDSKMKKSATRV
jgi:hypothetical protein